MKFKFIELLIPNILKKEQSLHEKARIFAISMLLFSILGITYSSLYLFLGNKVGGIAILCVTAFIFLILLTFKFMKTISVPLSLFCLSFLLMYISIAITSGGVRFSATSWMVLPPLFASLVAGSKTGWFWYIIFSLSVLAIYIAEVFGVTFPNSFSNSPHLLFLNWFHYFGLIFAVFVHSQIFERGISTLSKILENDKKILKEAQNELQGKNEELLSAVENSKIAREKLEEKSNQLLLVAQNAEEAKNLIEEKEEIRKKQQQDIEDTQKYLMDSVNEMLYEINKLAKGDLTIHLVPKRDDDGISKLYKGLNSSVKNVSEMLSEITSVVDNTEKSANQISLLTQQFANGINEQTDKTTQIAVSIEELFTTASQNAEISLNTSTAGTNNKNIAKEGGEIVAETINKINDIGNIVNSSREKMQLLGNSSKKIGEIVDVIADIADQTNLLALNAAIEAARAGEHGRGFAIVADEVRKLAERTTTATKEIYNMVKSIQSEANDSVKSMDNVTEEVKKGIDLVNKADISLQKIFVSSNDLLDMVNQIAASSEEQSLTIREISKSVDDISSVSVEATYGVGQIANATENLSELTEDLRFLVNKFKILS